MTNSYTTGPNLFRKFLFAGVTLALSVLFSVSSWGQVSTYNVTTSNTTYTEITGGTVVSTTAWDEEKSTSQTINSFVYNGSTITNIWIAANGWIQMGGTGVTSSGGTTPLSSNLSTGATGAVGFIAPFGRDIVLNGVGEIRWQYLAASNETVIQWKNCTIYLNTSAALNFQARLNHTTNTISFVYGTMSVGTTNTTGAQVGIKNGATAGTWTTTTAGTINSLTLANIPAGTACSWADAVSTRASATMFFSTANTSITCPSGTTFIFTPQSGAATSWVNPVTTVAAATGISTTAATISWTAPITATGTAATGYNIQYRAVGTCAWTNFSGNPVSTTSATLSGLTPATPYQVRIQSQVTATGNRARFSHPVVGTAANADGYTTAGYFTTLANPATVTGYTVAGVASNPVCSNGGQSVVITGTNFTSGTTSVSFGGIPGTGVSVSSATQLTVTAPALASSGTGFITVTNSSLTASATAPANAFSVQARPVVALSPAATVSPCGSFPTAVTASNTASATATTYAWSNSGTLSAATGATVNVLTTVNNSYVVTATDAFGCTGTNTLTATPTTPTAITVTPSQPYFCGTGGTIGIKATSTNPNYVYSFTAVEGGTISNVLADSCNYTISSTSAMRTDAIDAGAGCATTVYTSIGVFPFPTPAMSATPNTICQGQTTSLGSGLSAGNFSAACITPPAGLSSAPAGVTVNTLVLNGVQQTLPSGVANSGGLDDGKFGPVPLGFTFNYFGAAQTQLNIGTNGVLNFGAFASFSGSQYIFTGGFPNVANPASTIAICARDLRFGTPAGNGTLRYWTEGYAPNRRFVVQFINVPIWSGVVTTPSLSGFNNVEAVLFETTGQIEIKVADATNGTSTTAAEIQKYIGLQDATRTIGATAPNCSAPFQNNYWNGLSTAITSPLAWRFSPPSNYTTSWTPSADISVAASGTNLFTRTTNALSTLGTNTFNLVVTDQTTGCSNSGSPAPVSVEVLATPPTPIAAEVTGYGSVLGSGSAASTPLTICGAQTVTINCTTSLSGIESIRWFDAATGGNQLGTGASYTTPSLSTSDTVWVAVWNGVCESASRHLFRIVYNAPPAISVASNGPDNDVNCGTGVTYDMGYTATSANDPNYAYTWTNDGLADTFAPSGASVTLSSDSTTVTTVTAFDSGTGCSIQAVKAFSIYDFPTIEPTSVDSIVCVGDSTIVQSGVAQGAFSSICIAHAPRTAPVGATVLCAGGVQVTPHAPYNGLGLNAPLDDAGWSGIPIGFDFDYFGTNFTQLNVGTNGVANFGPYSAFNAGQYLFSSGFPSTSSPVNTIAVCATDLRMTTTGTIRYWTEGVAPNQVFVLEYLDCPAWSNINQLHSAQLHLFETTGRVEIHVLQAQGTGGLANKTIALQNGDGTIGTAAPVCDLPGFFWNNLSAVISAGNPQAWRFNPPVNYTFAWSPAGQISGSTSSANIVARPTGAASTTQVYTLQVTDNTTTCVGSPVNYPVEIIEVPALPNIVGYGLFSNTDGTNDVNFCGVQGVEWYCSDVLPAGWQVVYYTQAVGGVGGAFDATDTLTFVTGTAPNLVVAELSANDTIWASLDNGHCEGPRRQVVFNYQVPDTIAISNSSPINCGPSNLTYTSELVATSAAPYAYTWAPGANLNTTSGDSVTASISNTVVFTVEGTDGYCYASAQTAVSRYRFPTVVPTTQFDSVCPGATSVIYSNTNPGNFSVIAKGYSPESETGQTVTFLCTNGAEDVALSTGNLDDGGWFNVPLGFTFDFLGTNYSTVNVSTNGNIQFGSTANFSTGFTAINIPSASVPNNFVALFWGDLDMRNNSGEGSSIRYWTSGIAPNRVFNIKFDGPRFGQALTSRYTGVIALNEATGLIELDVQEVTHNGAVNTVMGAENFNGTIGDECPGRTTGPWQVSTPEGWILNPPADYAFNWLPSAEIDGSTVADTAIASPSVTTQYQLIVTDNLTNCDNSVNNQTFVTVGVATAAPVVAFTISDNTPTTGGILQTVTLTTTTAELGGETYLWNISPATATFVNGTTGTSRNPQVQFNAPGFYTVSLQITSCTGTAAVTLNNVINATAVYCFPSFSNSCSGGDEIGDVEIFNPQGTPIMQHFGTGCTLNATGYENYGSPAATPISGTTSCTFYQGSTYSIEVSSSYFNDYFGAWIDVNNDGDFADPLEFLGSSATPGNFASFELGIPSSNVIYGAHKMRILCVDNGAPLVQGDACINTTWGECHDYTVFIQAPVILNDIPQFAVNVQNSTNLTYPTCYAFTGNTALATNSPESAGITGGDVWYRFTAQSTAVAIKVTSTSMDDIIALYSRDAAGNYTQLAIENVGLGGNGDYEQLNYDGLTAGTQYWIAVGSNAGGGQFSICIQNLMRSGCATAIPVGGLRMCDAYRAVYRGAPSQGVTYTFNFTPTSGTLGSPTSVSGTNGLITLSNPTLALRYQGVYNVKVDVLYALSNSAGTVEPITVQGVTSDARCTGATIQAHPLVEVRSTQRCPANLLRSNYLVGSVVAGSSSSNVCGATNFTYRFRQVVSCGDTTTVGAATEYTTTATSPYLGLGVLANLPNAGAWNVEIRPNFAYGPGTYGPVRTISVNNTAAGSELEEGSVDGSEKVSTFVAANLYPNPNNGEMVNLNVAGIESDNVFVRITDAMGRIVYTNRYAVEGSLNTIVTFAEPLASGIYNVEFTVDGQIMTERMIVAKQ